MKAKRFAVLATLPVFLLSTFALVAKSSAENPHDTYLYKGLCPLGNATPDGEKKIFPGGDLGGGEIWQIIKKDGEVIDKYWVDRWGFAQCNCVSYVAWKLNELWDGQPPYFNNSKYYNTGEKNANWGNARHWYDKAIISRIGITDNRDKYIWDENALNGGFKNDVAWWDSWTGNPYGHVAMVVDSYPKPNDPSKHCVLVAQYNVTPNDYSEKELCQGTTKTGASAFPTAFLHIHQDHVYCLNNSSQCPNFESVGSASGTGIDGVHGGSSGNSTAQTDLVGHPKEYNNNTGETYDDRAALPVGVLLKFVGSTEVDSADAATGMSGSSSNVTVRWEVKVGDNYNSYWTSLGDKTISKSSLTKGNRVERTWYYTIPPTTQNGTLFSIRYTVDAKHEVFEKYEDNNIKIEIFTISNSVTERTPEQERRSLFQKMQIILDD